MILDNSDRKDWVKLYARCTPNGILYDFLEQVKADIESLEMQDDRATGYRFTAEKSGNRVYVKKFAQDSGEDVCPEEQVSFMSANHETVEVYYGNVSDHPDFTCNFRWDEQETICRITIDSKPYKLWQVCQKALRRLFFTKSD